MIVSVYDFLAVVFVTVEMATYKRQLTTAAVLVAAPYTEPDLTLQEYVVVEHRNKRKRGLDLIIFFSAYFPIFRYVLIFDGLPKDFNQCVAPAKGPQTYSP